MYYGNYELNCKSKQKLGKLSNVKGEIMTKLVDLIKKYPYTAGALTTAVVIVIIKLFF